MNRLLIGLGIAWVLAGCAAAPPSVDQGVDQVRVDAVERAAQHTGVRVYWVRMPQKVVRSGGA